MLSVSGWFAVCCQWVDDVLYVVTERMMCCVLSVSRWFAVCCQWVDDSLYVVSEWMMCCMLSVSGWFAVCCQWVDDLLYVVSEWMMCCMLSVSGCLTVCCQWMDDVPTRQTYLQCLRLRVWLPSGCGTCVSFVELVLGCFAGAFWVIQCAFPPPSPPHTHMMG